MPVNFEGDNGSAAPVRYSSPMENMFEGYDDIAQQVFDFSQIEMETAPVKRGLPGSQQQPERAHELDDLPPSSEPDTEEEEPAPPPRRKRPTVVHRGAMVIDEVLGGSSDEEQPPRKRMTRQRVTSPSQDEVAESSQHTRRRRDVADQAGQVGLKVSRVPATGLAGLPSSQGASKSNGKQPKPRPVRGEASTRARR